MNKCTALQTFAFPNLEIKADRELYVRFGSARVLPRLENSILTFQPFGEASFDTFFNGFSVGVWKQNCKIDDLIFRLSGSGRFILKFGLHRLGHSRRWLAEHDIILDPQRDTPIELAFWPQLDDGILYVYLTAISEGYVASGCFETKTKPQRDIKLGIVVTHFNRKQYVVPAIRRLKAGLLSDPDYKDHIDLVVVDNSQNLTQAEADGATLIPNQNLGGSGGFTRGLLHLEADGSFTHCLFMDDDASCEIESIRRCHRLLSFASKENFAVAGSMLRELEPSRLFEKGATYKKSWKALKSGLNMMNTNDLLLAEKVTDAPDYGAWWFFGFALADVNHYPFPFFVRGDDIMFGLMNKFHICTMNGISTWGEDFSLKSGPLPFYFDVRHRIILDMVLTNRGVYKTTRMLIKLFKQQLFSYNYASAMAVSLALEHVTRGPQFFVDNIDMKSVFPIFANFEPKEKLFPINREDYELEFPRLKKRHLLHRIAQKITLNGNLAPTLLLKDRVVLQKKDFSGNHNEIYGYKSVLYEYEPQKIGYLAHQNQKLFIINLGAGLDRVTVL